MGNCSKCGSYQDMYGKDEIDCIECPAGFNLVDPTTTMGTDQGGKCNQICDTSVEYESGMNSYECTAKKNAGVSCDNDGQCRSGHCASNNICCNCDAATADGNGECCTFCASGTGNCTRREASCRTGQCLNDAIGGFSPVSGGQSPANNSSPAGNNNSSGCSSSKLLATGGNITYYGDYTIHTFTFNGTFRVTNANLVSLDVLVVGGGGGGSTEWGSGGGGGEVVYNSSRGVSKQSYSITVGEGRGLATPNYPPPYGDGGMSSFAGFPFAAGGKTASARADSGGASGSRNGGFVDMYNQNYIGGGGAGAGGNGGAATPEPENYGGRGGNGGVGKLSDISGNDTYYGGGGGGSSYGFSGGAGGQGGGGRGNGNDGNSEDGSPNTGGGDNPYDDIGAYEYYPTCECDFSTPDGDVDGADLAAYIVDSAGISLDVFAADFGRTNCP